MCSALACSPKTTCAKPQVCPLFADSSESQCLVLPLEPVERMEPLTHDERTYQVLPNKSNPLQEELHCLKKFTDSKQITAQDNICFKANKMKFNVARCDNFPPQLGIDGFDNNLALAVITETKL